MIEVLEQTVKVKEQLTEAMGRVGGEVNLVRRDLEIDREVARRTDRS